jgi:Uma2 family endonuclease
MPKGNLEIDESAKYELERGKPVPSIAHSIIQSNLIFELNLNYGKDYKFTSELNILLSGKKYVPDVVIYPKFSFDLAVDEINMTEVPLTTIEILSPKQDLLELMEKKDFFMKAGAKSCWIVLPAMKAIAVYYQSTKYNFFTEFDILKDPTTNIEINLKGIFASE